MLLNNLWDGSFALINLLFTYLLVWGVAHSYEVRRLSQEQQLQQLAITDPLTQAINRLGLKSTFSQHQQQPLWLLLLDIDNFKSINDQFGHDAGDLVLQSLVKVMQQDCGKDRVFRLGGEEFCVLINGSRQQASETAERLLRTIANCPLNLDQSITYVSASAGLSPADETLSQALRQADEAMYQAKHSGKNKLLMSES